MYEQKLLLEDAMWQNLNKHIVNNHFSELGNIILTVYGRTAKNREDRET